MRDRLDFENLQMIASIKNLKPEATKEFVERLEEKLEDALEAIVWCDCHYEWLEKLANELESTQGNYPIPSIKWHTEEHVIWMLLVGMFGEWGTSIRSGWIEKTKECANYIRNLCARAKEGAE